MHINRALTIRLLRRQEWSEVNRRFGSRPSALSAMRQRRERPAARPSRRRASDR